MSRIQAQLDRRIGAEHREAAFTSRYFERLIRDRDIGAVVLVVLILFWVNDKFHAHNGLIAQMQTQASDEKVARAALTEQMLRKDTFSQYAQSTEKTLSRQAGEDDGTSASRAHADVVWTRALGVIMALLALITLLALATHGFTT